MHLNWSGINKCPCSVLISFELQSFCEYILEVFSLIYISDTIELLLRLDAVIGAAVSPCLDAALLTAASHYGVVASQVTSVISLPLRLWVG